jgi:hypothetical protein
MDASAGAGQAAIEQAIQQGRAALKALNAPELLVATADDVRPVDSPTVASLVLSALAASSEPPRDLAEPSLRYLLAAREPSSTWRFSHALSQAALPSTAESVRALVALKQWGVELDYAGALDSLLFITETGQEPGEGEDILASIELLFLGSLLGRPLPKLADRVVGRVRQAGLEDVSHGSLQASSSLLAYLLARWLRRGGDHWLLANLLTPRLIQQWERAPSIHALDSALMMNALMGLERPSSVDVWDKTLDSMAQRILAAQSEEGLWPALPLFAQTGGTLYGSLQITTAICLEALEGYLRVARVAGPRPLGTVLHAGDQPAQLSLRPGNWKDTLGALRDALPLPLFGPEAFARLEAVGACLPNALEADGAFEIRLPEGDSRVDFIVRLRQEARTKLAGLHPEVHLPAQLLEVPEWRRIQAFARQWNDPASPLHQGVDTFWLEFDLDKPPVSPPRPFTFACFRDLELPCGEQARREHAARYRSLLHALFPLLLEEGVPLSEEMLRCVDACIDALPSNAQLYCVAAMPVWRTSAVRLGIKNVPPERLLPYLEEVRWPGSAAQLQSQLDWLLPLRVNRFFLNLDMAPGMLPRLGLECSFTGRRQPAEEPQWAALFDQLVARGLCSATKRDLVLAWPGRQISTRQHGSQLLETTFQKRLGHIKLTLSDKAQPEAKCYIGVHRSSDSLLP